MDILKINALIKAKYYRPIRYPFLAAIICVACFSSCRQDDRQCIYDIIPQVSTLTLDNGFSEIDSLKFYFNKGDTMAVFFPWIQQWSNRITLLSSPEARNIDVALDNELNAGAYRLSITKYRINIDHSDAQGLRNALSSLHQLYVLNEYRLPLMTISDAPKFPYRGMHLDVSRHMFAVSDIKRYLDYLAFYKFNKFHWHLTDDQGWRIEIKSFPRLHEIGGYRHETLVGHYNHTPQKFDGKKYGGYYTQSEIKDIVNYAGQRGIDVIPEIDLPGHSSAILAAYPNLACEDKAYKTATKWGVFYDVLCPKEETFEFLFAVFDELLELFPSDYYHIGGDECPKESWRKSEFCQNLIAENKLKDEDGLQSYFINRLQAHLNARGKKIIGWDEILEGALAPGATVMSWRGMEGGIKAAQLGHDVIMTPTSHCYFDYYQSESANEPLAIGGYLPIDKVYQFDPIPNELDSSQQHHVLGGQGNVWTEYIDEFKEVEYMSLARAAALSEVLWGKSEDDIYSFYRKLWHHIAYWQSRNVNIANHLLNVNCRIVQGADMVPEVQVYVPVQAAELSAKLPEDSVYHIMKPGHLSILTKGDYSFYASHDNVKGAIKTIKFNPHKGNAATIELSESPAEKYAGNGAYSIINGVYGNANKYGGSEWLGFEGLDFEAHLKWQDTIKLNRIDLRFFNAEGQWIYLPAQIRIYKKVKSDYHLIGALDKINSKGTLARVRIAFHGTAANEIKIIAKNYGRIPEGRQGSGHRAWLFVDEIEIN